MQTFNGKTLVYGVIGDPIGHSLSPQIHGYFADLCGINMAYVPFHVKNENIPDAIKGAHALGIKGLNVTVPHKKAVIPHLVKLDKTAEKIGAVNTLVWSDDGYIGYNTDYAGIKKTVASKGLTFKDKSVIITGAGGSAYPAAVSAADGGAKKIALVNRTKENAENLASHVKSYYNIEMEVTDTAASGFDIFIQTTTVGFGALEGQSPVPDDYSFDGTQLAFDIIFTPQETAFLRHAKKSGVPNVINGFPMLVYQAAESFGLWQENIPNEDAHVTELEKRLYIN